MIHSISKNMRNFLIIGIALLLSSCALFPRDSLPEQAIKPLEQLEPQLDTKASQISDEWWKAFGAWRLQAQGLLLRKLCLTLRKRLSCPKLV